MIGKWILNALIEIWWVTNDFYYSSLLLRFHESQFTWLPLSLFFLFSLIYFWFALIFFFCVNQWKRKWIIGRMNIIFWLVFWVDRVNWKMAEKEIAQVMKTDTSHCHIAYHKVFLSFPFWFHCLMLLPVRLVKALLLAQQSNNPVQYSPCHNSIDLYLCKPTICVYKIHYGRSIWTIRPKRFNLWLTPWP